jgi:hypothetical protein
MIWHDMVWYGMGMGMGMGMVWYGMRQLNIFSGIESNTVMCRWLAMIHASPSTSSTTTPSYKPCVKVVLISIYCMIGWLYHTVQYSSVPYRTIMILLELNTVHSSCRLCLVLTLFNISPTVQYSTVLHPSTSTIIQWCSSAILLQHSTAQHPPWNTAHSFILYPIKHKYKQKEAFIMTRYDMICCCCCYVEYYIITITIIVIMIVITSILRCSVSPSEYLYATSPTSYFQRFIR